MKELERRVWMIPAKKYTISIERLYCSYIVSFMRTISTGQFHLVLTICQLICARNLAATVALTT